MLTRTILLPDSKWTIFARLSPPSDWLLWQTQSPANLMASTSTRSGEVLKKRVQELARNGEDPPQRYIRKEEDRPTKTSAPASPVPVIDLHLLSLTQGNEEDRGKETEMEKLRSALQSWGFFQAVGHGIPRSLLDEMGRVAREFFSLPIEQKQRYSGVAESGHEGGLEAYGNDNIASEEQILDWSDRLYLLLIPEDERRLDFWPDNPSNFREILQEYAKKVKEAAELILKALAKLLDLEENYFVRQFGERAPMYGRFNCYPPCSRPDLVTGLISHSDGSGITLLLQDNEVDGLETLRDGEWVKIPAMPGALLVNLGDQMEIMTNGIFKSPVHRAVTNSEKERLSLAIFYVPELKKEIEPAEKLVETRNQSLYNKVKVEDYLQVYMQNYMHGKRTIDWAKV